MVSAIAKAPLTIRSFFFPADVPLSVVSDALSHDKRNALSLAARAGSGIDWAGFGMHPAFCVDCANVPSWNSRTLTGKKRDQ